MVRDALEAVDRVRGSPEGEVRARGSPATVADARGDLAHAGAHQLDPSKSARATARRVIAAEFAAVRAGIHAAASDSLSVAARLGGVHIARRGLKRIWALQDLLQSGFPQGKRIARAAIRRAKASLAEARQRDALAALLEELCERRGQPLTAMPTNPEQGAHHTPSPRAIQDALSAIEIAERSMRLVAGAPLDWHEIIGRYGEAWQKARKAAKAGWLGRSESALHDLRKNFQRLADQSAFLGGCMTARAGSARKRLRRAAEHLGRSRDLDLLADKIRGSSAPGRGLAKRALVLRSAAVRSARNESRIALRSSFAQVARSLNRGIARIAPRHTARD